MNVYANSGYSEGIKGCDFLGLYGDALGLEEHCKNRGNLYFISREKTSRCIQAKNIIKNNNDHNEKIELDLEPKVKYKVLEPICVLKSGNKAVPFKKSKPTRQIMTDLLPLYIQVRDKQNLEDQKILQVTSKNRVKIDLKFVEYYRSREMGELVAIHVAQHDRDGCKKKNWSACENVVGLYWAFVRLNGGKFKFADVFYDSVQKVGDFDGDGKIEMYLYEDSNKSEMMGTTYIRKLKH